MISCTQIAVAMLIISVSGVDAHHAGKNWTYPAACCRGDHSGGDCRRVPFGRVTERRNGYTIRLFPGDFPDITRHHTFVVPFGDELPSGDRDFHICLYPSEDHVNCFFAPPPGA